MILYSNAIQTNERKNKLLQVRKKINPLILLLLNKLILTRLAAPDVIVKTITEDWEFILIACDGIWDVLSNEEVLKFVRARIAQQMSPETVDFELIFLNHRVCFISF